MRSRLQNGNSTAKHKPYTRVKWRRYLFYPILACIFLLLVIPTRDLFVYEGWRWVYVLLLSISMSFCLTPVFSRIAQKTGIVDLPDSRKVHADATPLLGGAALFIAFLTSIVVNGIYSEELLSILTASSVLFIIGTADDIREIPAWVKLIGQLLSAAIIIKGGIVLAIVPGSLGLFADLVNILLTVLWIIGITNAMNFFDGMDGLAAGLGTIISLFLGIVAFQTHQPFLGWVSVSIMGSCIGFLPYNFRIRGNASIFLGDAGSTVLGFVLACVAVYGEWAIDNPVAALVSPLLIFWVLIFDMTYITVDRIATGKVKTFRQWIDYVGRDHLHHRLEQVLGGKRISVLMIYMLGICLGISAVVLRDARPVDAILLILQAVIIVMLVTVLERRGRTLRGPDRMLTEK